MQTNDYFLTGTFKSIRIVEITQEEISDKVLKGGKPDIRVVAGKKADE